MSAARTHRPPNKHQQARRTTPKPFGLVVVKTRRPADEKEERRGREESDLTHV